MTTKRESKIQRECMDYAELALQGRLIKTNAAGRNGWPDCTLLVPRCAPVFVEFKSKSGKLSSAQLRWAEWLVTHGFKHAVVTDLDEFVDICEELQTDDNPRKAKSWFTRSKT